VAVFIHLLPRVLLLHASKPSIHLPPTSYICFYPPRCHLLIRPLHLCCSFTSNNLNLDIHPMTTNKSCLLSACFGPHHLRDFIYNQPVRSSALMHHPYPTEHAKLNIAQSTHLANTYLPTLGFSLQRRKSASGSPHVVDTVKSLSRGSLTSEQIGKTPRSR
jgi:hypothetical protein